jgi:hypothetical protein
LHAWELKSRFFLIQRNSLRIALGVLCLACSLSLPAFTQAPCAMLPPNESSGNGSAPCLPPLTRRERLKDYLHTIVYPEALLGTAAASGIAQARNSPSAWEQGMAGYGRRFASRVGKDIVNSTVRLGIESALGEDSRYYPSPRGETGSRIAHVFRTTLLARRADGHETLAVGRITGAFSAGLISRAWHPEGHRSIRQGFQSGALSYGFDFASHAFEEFWPDLRRHLPF